MQTVELVGRLFIALAVVLGVIWLIAKKARAGTRQKLRSDKLIDVLGRQSLTRSSSVAVVRIADQALIIGVTDTNVRVLGEVELDAAAAHIVAGDPGARPGHSSKRRSNRRGALIGDVTVAAHQRSETPQYDDVLAASGADSSAVFITPGTLSISDIDEVRARRRDAAKDVIPGAIAANGGRLSGSALSPATWKQTIDALREMTARKG